MAKGISPTLKRIKQAKHICTDREAMNTFYNNEIGKIRSLVYKIGNGKIEAEEIFQEGITSAINAVNNGNYNGKSDFAAYFYTICKNLCLKKFQANKKVKSLDDLESSLVDEIQDDYTDLIKLMLKLKDGIKSICKEIIDLRYGIGFGDNRSYRERGANYKEIASKLGITEDNARKRFSNCIKDFRELVMGHSQFQLLQLNAERNYHIQQIKLIIKGDEKINTIEREKRIKDLAVWYKVNTQIAKIWIEAEKYID